MVDALYDARGNRYRVATPDALGRYGLAIPRDPAEAAATARDWATIAIDILCRGPAATGDTKGFISDGLLVGPFELDRRST
jgi:diaminopimelate epimerase